MIKDKRTEFASKTTLPTAGTGLALVGDVVDLQVARDIGNGRPIYLVIQVDTAVTSAGAATVEFQLASDSQSNIRTDGSAVIHSSSGAIPKATLVAGYGIVIPVPAEDPAYKRYLGILQNVGTAALTAGKINAFLTLDVARWKAYPGVV